MKCAIKYTQITQESQSEHKPKMRLPLGFPLTGIHIKMNCSDLILLQYIPTLPEVLNGNFAKFVFYIILIIYFVILEMGTYGIVMVVVAVCLTILITLIFIEETIRLYKRWPLQTYCLTIASLAVFPVSLVISYSSFLNLLLPNRLHRFVFYSPF